jgi:ABC-type uncharacterized transport system substrate-binding protein
VFASVTDPGFVASLAQPSGNVTGFSNYDPITNLFKTFLESVIEAGGTGGDFSKAEQCVGAFARNMKRAAFAYDKACEVAEQIVTTRP